MQTTNGIGARHLIKTKSIRPSLLPRQRTQGTFRPSHLAPHPSEKSSRETEEVFDPRTQNPDHTFSHTIPTVRLHASTPPQHGPVVQPERKSKPQRIAEAELDSWSIISPQKLLLCFLVVWSFTLGTTRLTPFTAQCFQETRLSFFGVETSWHTIYFDGVRDSYD
jgi:hypothetical protein